MVQFSNILKYIRVFLLISLNNRLLAFINEQTLKLTCNSIFISLKIAEGIQLLDFIILDFFVLNNLIFLNWIWKFKLKILIYLTVNLFKLLKLASLSVDLIFFTENSLLACCVIIFLPLISTIITKELLVNIIRCFLIFAQVCQVRILKNILWIGSIFVFCKIWHILVVLVVSFIDTWGVRIVILPVVQVIHFLKLLLWLFSIFSYLIARWAFPFC